MSDQAEKVLSSRYVQLERPAFVSSIPPHLTMRLTDQERYLVETLSKMEQQNGWLVDHVLELNKAAMDTDVRLQAIENWKTFLSGKWAVAAAAAVMVIPLLLEAVLEWAKKHISP